MPPLKHKAKPKPKPPRKPAGAPGAPPKRPLPQPQPVGGSRQMGPTLADVERGRAAAFTPVPRVLSDNGISSIVEFNRRLEAATRAHNRAFGSDPSPGLAFDLVRIPLADHEYDGMFKGLRNSRPKFQRPAVGAVIEAADEANVIEATRRRFAGGAAPGAGGPVLGQPGFDPSRHDPLFGARRNPELMGTFGQDAAESSQLFVTQVIENFKSIPGGIVMVAGTIGGDVKAALPFTRGGPGFSGTRAMVVEMGKGMWEVVSNLTEHPGDLFVLGLSLVPTPYALVGRTAAAARLLAVGEIKAAGRALATRPLPGTFALGVGAHRAEVLLAESAIVRAVQKHRLTGKQRKLEERWGPNGTGPVWRSVPRAVRWLAESPERTYVRNARKTLQHEIAAELGPMREVQRLSKWDTEGVALLEDLEARLPWVRRGIRNRLAVEKALQVLSTDDPDPLRSWRRLHERMIQAVDDGERWASGVSREAHAGHLEALDLAERYLRGLEGDKAERAWFGRLYEAVATQMEGQQRVKMIEFGLDPVRVEHRIAALGAIVRFDVTPADLRSQVPRSVEKALEEREQLGRRIARLEKEWARETRDIDRRWEFLADLDYDFEPVRRRMSESEAQARLNELQPLVDVIYEKAREMVEPDAAARKFNQALNNMKRGPGKGRRKTVTQQVDLAMKRKIDELLALESRRPEIVQAQSIIREYEALLRALENRDPERLEAARFLGESLEGDPLPFTKGDTPHMVYRAEVDPELVKQTRQRIAYLEKRDQEQGTLAEIARLRRDLAQLTRPTRDRLKAELDALYGRVDELEARIMAGTRERPVLEQVVKDPLDRADYARGFRPFYLPTVRVVHDATTGAKNVDIRSGASKYGIRRTPDLLAELSHEFTGEAVRIGDFRVDVTGFSTATYRRTVRAVAIRDLHDGLWHAGLVTDRPARGLMPVRDVSQVPESLKRFMAEIDDGSLRASAADSLTEAGLDEMQAFLFPGVWDDKGKRYVLPSDVPRDQVRWVDERFVLDKGRDRDFYDRLDRWIGRPALVLNEPFRLLNLFLRPAYILNALSASATALLHQGFLMPTTLGRAIHARHWLGEDGAARLDDLAGQGKALSYLTERTPVSDALAHGWAKITDAYFRRAAVLHELRRAGFRDREQIRQALGLGDELTPEQRGKVAEASRRAKRVMIDFELRPFEKAVLRHIFFVYAFQSRSVLWTAHAVMDHPTAFGIMGQLSQMSEDEIDEALGPVPEWFERTGYVYAGQDEQGRPLVQNWNQLSPVATLVDLANPFRGLFVGTRYQSIEELFGGFFGFTVRAVTGRDEFGRPLEGGVIPAAAEALFGETSLGAFFERRAAEEESLPATDITDRESWIRRHNAGRDLPVFGYREDVWEDPWMIGGLAPRSVNEIAAEARYWNDRPWQERLKHEMGLLMQGLKAQARLLGREVPQEIRLAARIAFRVSEAKGRYRSEQGVSPTAFEEIRIWVGSMRNEGALSEEEGAELLRLAKSARDDPEQVKGVLELVKAKASVATGLAEWDEDVRTAAQTMSRDGLAAVADALRQDGLGNYGPSARAPEKARREYARRYLQWLEQNEGWRDEDAAFAEFRVRDAEYGAWLAQGDRPVEIDGVRFPSFQRTRYGQQTPTERARQRRLALVDFYGSPKSWEYLTALEKELLGRAVTPSVQAGWAEFRRLERAYLADHPEKSYMDKTMKREVVRRLDRDPRYRGVAADFVFAEQIALRRFMGTSVYQGSENRSRWDVILKDALDFERALQSGQYGKTYVRNKWREWVDRNRARWLSDSRFREEVDELGPNFLGDLLDA